MAKVQFSDVTPPEKRSIRNIPIPNSGKRKVPPPEIKIEKEQTASPILNQSLNSNFNSNVPPAPAIEKTESSPYEYYYPKNKINEEEHASSGSTGRRWLFGGIVIVLVAGFIVGMMTVFASATVNIVPKSEEINVNTNITATNKPEADSVRYEVIKLSKSKTASVTATGEEVVEEKASGKIIIYNNFSAEPQRLIIRTRFESPEGLIFRIPESVTVPGKTVKDGVETPGSIEVQVFADEAGEKYNIKKSDFTIPGFKNDETRYKTFYARSSTNMTGGFVGKRKTASAADKQAALQNMDSEIEAELKKDLESKIPEGLASLPGSIIYKSAELQTQEEGSSVVVGKEVTAYAMIFNAEDLSQKIADKYISESANWNAIKPTIKDFSQLSITNMPKDLENIDKLELSITGKAKIWADIDTNLISEKLIGAPKKEAAGLREQFPGISSVTVTLRPIWKQSFPDNPAKVHVDTVITD